ncbi:MAG TPA: hypothetical protein ENK79_02135 [Campylobacterales bacterium]|nr:hypothetical protein [Campylobacterales bacterium]
MKNILILANGDMAKHFVQWVGKSRIDDNNYYITCNNHTESILKTTSNLSFIKEDPTSYLRLSNIMRNIEFAVVFIVMENREEGFATYRNIRLIAPRLRIVFSSKWDDLYINDDNVKVINIHELMANSLYEELPNVPVIAKNIGLAKGEIMELLVPFGSSYAYRHIGSVSHRKWRIILIYRKDKQIFVNNATMIKPNDRLIIAGNSTLLEEVYSSVTERKRLFPEPFGKNLYFIIDFNQNIEDIEIMLKEAIYLKEHLLDSKLYIRVLHMKNSNILEELKKNESETIYILDDCDSSELFNIIEYDTSECDIGLFLIDDTIFRKKIQERLYLLKRPIYIFGENSIYNIPKAMVLMGDEVEMEMLSSSVFDICETLNLKLSLCNYDPEGDFSEKKNILEHYETLANLHSFKIEIKEKKSNPIREIRAQSNILHIAPFDKSVMNRPIANFFSQNFSRYFLGIKKHPTLLIPIED